ncbi:hypothetical protein IFM89_036892 [Coptis chinensis]|uniref:Core Histone H2A/H2B/H3 domain-containing protein n=1 Tax=Coptis chinensis TaxID=261450 RepID=A0A835HWP1_9MAGN|nr:hypothetical protein IFM89_036892 [Coptis chinensis]
MENNNNKQALAPPSAPAPSSSAYPSVIPQQQSFHHLLQQQQNQLQMFWTYQRQEIEQVNDFRNHQLPLARIKKIMKADEDVRMISAEAPILFAKACELFILELTIRSWLHAEENKRRTLQKNDIAAAITRTDIFDFLVDIVPRDEIKDEAGSMAFYGPGGVTVGRPALQGMEAGMYGCPPPSQAWQSVWQAADVVDGGYGVHCEMRRAFFEDVAIDECADSSEFATTHPFKYQQIMFIPIKDDHRVIVWKYGYGLLWTGWYESGAESVWQTADVDGGSLDGGAQDHLDGHGYVGHTSTTSDS